MSSFRRASASCCSVLVGTSCPATTPMSFSASVMTARPVLLTTPSSAAVGRHRRPVRRGAHGGGPDGRGNPGGDVRILVGRRHRVLEALERLSFFRRPDHLPAAVGVIYPLGELLEDGGT